MCLSGNCSGVSLVPLFSQRERSDADMAHHVRMAQPAAGLPPDAPAPAAEPPNTPPAADTVLYLLRGTSQPFFSGFFLL